MNLSYNLSEISSSLVYNLHCIMYGVRHSIGTKISNYHYFTFYIYNMFIFYCIIFSRLSNNKSRKLLVLSLMPCLYMCLFLYCQITSGTLNCPNSGRSATSHRGAAPEPHRDCNGQRGRPLRAKQVGHRKRKIYYLGGNFKFYGNGHLGLGSKS